MAQPCREVIPHLSRGAPESSGETAGWTRPAPNTSFRPRPEPTYSWILCELQKLRLPNKRKTKNMFPRSARPQGWRGWQVEDKHYFSYFSPKTKVRVDRFSSLCCRAESWSHSFLLVVSLAVGRVRACSVQQFPSTKLFSSVISTVGFLSLKTLVVGICHQKIFSFIFSLSFYFWFIIITISCPVGIFPDSL